MGMSLGGGDEGSSGNYFQRQSAFTDINITPFVDVILVLLIIFMVTAPFAVSGVNVQLPKSQAKPLKLNDDPIVVSIDADGVFYLGKMRVNKSELSEKIKAAIGEEKDTLLYIRADQGVPYARVMEALGAAQVAGVSKVGMMGESGASRPK